MFRGEILKRLPFRAMPAASSPRRRGRRADCHRSLRGHQFDIYASPASSHSSSRLENGRVAYSSFSRRSMRYHPQADSKSRSGLSVAELETVTSAEASVKKPKCGTNSTTGATPSGRANCQRFAPKIRSRQGGRSSGLLDHRYARPFASVSVPCSRFTPGMDATMSFSSSRTTRVRWSSSSFSVPSAWATSVVPPTFSSSRPPARRRQSATERRSTADRQPRG